LSEEKSAQELQDWKQRCAEVEQHNSDLTNLFVASSRLHQSLDRREVLAAIQEIVINLVGSEELAVFEVSEDGLTLELVDSFGVEKEKFDSIPFGLGAIGEVAARGESKMGPDDARARSEGLTACVPLMLGKQAIGAVAVFRLLPQKPGLQPIDRDLFDLLRAQAGLALYCTRLVQRRAEEP
jgi:GAF domain-containing protein